MFELQALFSLYKLRNNNRTKNISNMPATAAATTKTSSSTTTAAVNVSLLLLICMAYLICPARAWMPDVRPDLPSSKYLNTNLNLVFYFILFLCHIIIMCM